MKRLISIVLKIFGRHVVFAELSSVDLGHIRVGGIFDSADHFGLEELPFFEQFLDAFGVGLWGVRQSLRVSGLTARIRTHSLFFNRRDFVGLVCLLGCLAHGIIIARESPLPPTSYNDVSHP
jgi:hypothetical protein